MYIHSVKLINFKSIGDYPEAEVILELTKASAMSGYRYGDRATEIYESFVNNGTFIEEEREI